MFKEYAVPLQNAFKKWYDKHKEKYNADRRKRYSSDPDYRERMLTAVRSRRNSQPDDNRMLIGLAAGHIGRDPQTIRSWETRKLIPRPEGVVRYYTLQQVALLTELALFLDQNNRWSPDYHKRLKELSTKIKENWDGD